MKQYIVLDGEGGYSEFDSIIDAKSFLKEIDKPFAPIYRMMSNDEVENDVVFLSIGCKK